MRISYKDESKKYIKVTSSYFYKYEVLFLRFYFVTYYNER